VGSHHPQVWGFYTFHRNADAYIPKLLECKTLYLYIDDFNDFPFLNMLLDMLLTIVFTFALSRTADTRTGHLNPKWEIYHSQLKAAGFKLRVFDRYGYGYED